MCYSLSVMATRLALLSCLLLNILQLTAAGYTFEIHLVRYWNPNHLLANAQTCCEFDFCNPCENAFRFCLHERGDRPCTGENTTPCSMGNIQTRLIPDNNDDITFTDGGSVGDTLTNPLSFPGDLWRPQVDICWSVHDLDSSYVIDDESDRIGTVRIPVPPLVPGNLTEVLEFSMPNGHAHIRLQFRLVCDDPNSVLDCSGPCVPTNDSTGHFSCDNETGEIVCLEGYRDPWSRCTKCVPSTGCSPDNGDCVLGGECRCKEGYTGENCTECLPAASCSPDGGYCTQPGECLCREGYSGDNCSVCNPSVITCEAPSSTVVISSSQFPALTSSLLIASSAAPSPQATPSSSSSSSNVLVTEPTMPPSVAEPFFSKSSLLLFSVIGNALIVVVVGTLVVVALIYCFRRRSKKRSFECVRYDIAKDVAKVKMDNKERSSRDGDDHMYESLDLYTPSPTRRYGISAIGPTYAAVNAMHNVAQDNGGIDLEKNTAYDTANAAQDTVDVRDNIAYAAVDRGQQQQSKSCRSMPLPNLP